MGQRSSTETIAAILQAFLRKRSWTQADLAREVGIGVPALRKRLTDLAAAGMPLGRDEDHPHVWWSVPKDWFPGTVAFEAPDIPELLRLLCRLPAHRTRDRLIQRIIQAAPKSSNENPRSLFVTNPITDGEESCWAAAEDSAVRKQTLFFRYYSASRGSVEARHASVQRIVVGPPARALALCHRDGKLKWFRVDNMFSAKADPSVPYRSASTGDIETVLAESLDGYHGGSEAVFCSFTVSGPEARWVSGNLPGPMSVECIDGGIRVSTTTAGVLPLARFVVSLGGSARAETPELLAIVRNLARGALRNATPRGAEASLNDCTVAPNRSTGSERAARYTNEGG